MRRRGVLVAAVVVVIALTACGGSDDTDDADPGACKDAEGGRVGLVADDLRWDTDCLRAPPGPLTIEVDNRDDGQNHNVHLPDAPGSPGTELAPGPSRQELEVDLASDAYEFVCDIHPNMVGTLTVG